MECFSTVKPKRSIRGTSYPHYQTCPLTPITTQYKLTNPDTLTAYSLLLKSTSSTANQRPPNHMYFGRKIRHFLVKARTKIPLRIHQSTPFQVIFFLRRGLAPPKTLPRRRGVPSPHIPLLAFWIRPASPEFQPDLRHRALVAIAFCRHTVAAYTVIHSIKLFCGFLGTGGVNNICSPLSESFSAPALSDCLAFQFT